MASLGQAKENAGKIGRDIEAIPDLFSGYHTKLATIRDELTARVRANNDGMQFTENGLRREMLRPPRDTYIYQTGDEWDRGAEQPRPRPIDGALRRR